MVWRVLMAMGLLSICAQARSYHKGKHHGKLFRDDWSGPQEFPAFNDNSLTEEEGEDWKQWKADDVNLAEKKAKDLMKEVKQEQIPQFEDPCKNVFCHYGRVCQLGADGVGRCQCAPDDFCAGHNKRVCGTNGEWYQSHCELHRMACVKAIHIGIDHSAKGCSMRQLKDINNKGLEEKLEVKVAKEKLKETKEEESQEKKEEVEPAATEGEETPVQVVTEEASNNDTSDNILPPVLGCTELEFERLKGKLLMYHCARIGDNCDDQPARKQFLANIMFSYYDHDNSGVLVEGELSDVEHRGDHLDALSPYCSLADMLTYDDGDDQDSKIDLQEFYAAFNIPAVVLEDGLTTFTTSVTAGNSIELKCDIKGSTDIIWKRNGGLLDDITTDDIKMFEDGSLYISNLGLHHMGNYTCQDKFIDNIIQTHVLRVQVPPRVRVSPSTQFHTTGSSVTLKCHADGVPAPEILWEMNEAPLQEADNQHYVTLHNNATLEIKTATYTKDTGAYKCKARNVAGVAQDIATVFIENSELPQYSEGESVKEAFVVFHDKGYTMYEPNRCHIEHQISASFSSFKRVPEVGETLVSLCGGEEICSWGGAVNVNDKYVYISQPKLHRIVVIDLKDRANPVEIIATDKYPVSVQYVEHLDQVWVTCWNQEQQTGAKTVVVIRQASEDMTHHTVHTQPIGNRFDLISALYLPPNNDLKHHFNYGYVTHTDQKALYKLDLQAMKYAKTISLADFDCLPQSVAFIPLGGQVMVHCLSSGAGATEPRSSRLVLDYVTDKVIEYTDLGGEPHVSPDSRFMVIINRHDNTLAVYRIHDDGKLEHLFDEYTNIHVSSVWFFPADRGRSYDFYASSVDKNDVLYINLASGKVEMIEGVGGAMQPSEWQWSGENRVIVGGDVFGEFLMTPSRDTVVVIDGRRRHVQCEWQHVAHGNVIVWLQPNLL